MLYRFLTIHFFFFHVSLHTASAQLPNVWSMLEGRWYNIQQHDTLYATWAYADQYTLEQRVFRLRGKDTLSVSRAVAQCRKKNCGLTQWTETGERAYFHLVSDAYDRLIWENNDPEGLPKRLDWVAVSMNCSTVLADRTETGFRRMKEHLVFLGRRRRG